MAIITRHPIQQIELELTLSAWGSGEMQAALEQLISSGRAQKVERYGVTLWSSVGSHFPQGNPESCR